ncbi:DedA family protein [Sneathiella marina]|uniref:DedA family protein n=1 Tax=Sneathiella marina TaxID=2950108 RepID=A0ABY4W8G5_9PROT|nr:YqaA family protein [Sneathiella marina]USG63136.1 DedA family protein [Sneathiella marina]
MMPITAYGTMFLSAFLSATLLPGSSEALLATYIAAEQGNTWILLLMAVTGNVLGSIVNWFIGRFLSQYSDRRWFPISEKRYAQAINWFNKYGKWSLLFAWVPVIGDPLTIVAGGLRVPMGIFIILVTAGKLVRYLLILQAALIWVG